MSNTLQSQHTPATNRRNRDILRLVAVVFATLLIGHGAVRAQMQSDSFHGADDPPPSDKEMLTDSGRRHKTDTAKLASSGRLSRWEQLMSWDFMMLPFAGYSPETSWQFGLTGVYYFRTPYSSQYSDLNFDGGYTLLRQWYLNINSRTHFTSGTTCWFLDANLSARHYPDRYWGTGLHNPATSGNSVEIDNNHFNIDIKPSLYLSHNLILGASVRGYWGNTTSQTPIDTIRKQLTTNGFGKLAFIQIGASVCYDSRDMTYYPHKGLFAKIDIRYNQQIIYGGAPSASATADFRHFVTLYHDLIFAYQAYTAFNLGASPFQLMPTIGGQDLLRGIRAGRYRDDCVALLQAELRIPIWKFLKATTFASVGDSYNYRQTYAPMPKIGYGIGLRACIHQAKTNIRLDIARQNHGSDWSVYFTVKEAF